MSLSCAAHGHQGGCGNLFCTDGPINVLWCSFSNSEVANGSSCMAPRAPRRQQQPIVQIVAAAVSPVKRRLDLRFKDTPAAASTAHVASPARQLAEKVPVAEAVVGTAAALPLGIVKQTRRPIGSRQLGSRNKRLLPKAKAPSAQSPRALQLAPPAAQRLMRKARVPVRCAPDRASLCCCAIDLLMHHISCHMEASR